MLFFISETEICNFADDNTIYTCGYSLENIFARLETELQKILNWFENSSLKTNPNKFQFMVPGKRGCRDYYLNVKDTL